METHDSDPTTGQASDPWDKVSDEFEQLRERLKETYRSASDENGPSEDEIKDALATLAGAWGRMASSVTVALRDPEVRDRVKTAASSFASAVGRTISDLGSELADEDSEEE